MSMSKGDGWIQTFTGKAFYPLDPDPDDINIIDIAHALSNICRFTGHCTKFYSVAQHSVYVSNVVPEHLALEGLLHDASEAYLCDIARPLKRMSEMKAYIDADEKLTRVIAKKFKIDHELASEIKDADNRILFTEKRDIMVKEPKAWNWSYKPYDFVIIPKAPNDAEHEFLDRAQTLLDARKLFLPCP